MQILLYTEIERVISRTAVIAAMVWGLLHLKEQTNFMIILEGWCIKIKKNVRTLQPTFHSNICKSFSFKS